MIDPAIENKINLYLQRKVCIFVDGSKPLKEGKLLMFRFKEFYFNFTIKSNSTSKILELPYPFKIDDGDNCLHFSYKVKDFAAKNEDLEFKMLLYKPEKKNKMYDSVITLSAVD